MTLAWLGMAGTSFAAALLQATNGFGFAVLAVPFFLLLAPPGEAVPLIVIISLSTSIFTLRGLYRSVEPALLRRLVIGSFVALPLGLLAAAHANAAALGAIAGVVVTGFAVVVAWQRCRARPACIAIRPRNDLAIGVVSGFATASVGMAGPPVLIYLMLGGAPMRAVRATLLAFFVLIYAATLAAMAAFVGVPRGAWLIAASLLPFVWAGGTVGLRVGDRLGEATAAALAVAVLAVAGLYTLAAAAHAALW